MDMKASCAEKVSELVLKRLNEAVRRAWWIEESAEVPLQTGICRQIWGHIFFSDQASLIDWFDLFNQDNIVANCLGEDD